MMGKFALINNIGIFISYRGIQWTIVDIFIALSAINNAINNYSSYYSYALNLVSSSYSHSRLL